MATDRQIEYLRGLGVDPRVDFADLSKEEASDWIQELKGYHDAVGLLPDRPVGKGDLTRLAARDDAFVLPPARSVSSGPVAPGNGSKDRPASASTSGASVRDDRAVPAVPADEAWWKLEVSRTVRSESGDDFSVTVAGTEHYRRSLDLRAAEVLAERVRSVLRKEIDRIVTGHQPAQGLR